MQKNEILKELNDILKEYIQIKTLSLTNDI